MERALRSQASWLRAASARMALAFVLAFAGSAKADDPDSNLQVVMVPAECIQFLSVPGGPSSPVGWDTVLSFAACIQDGSVYRVDRLDLLAGFVDQLQAALEPSIQFYTAAIEEGPSPIKLRAAYYVALGQVGLITRARASIASPQLRRPLESLLEPHARLAYLIFMTIDRAVAHAPELAPDVVTRYMVRSARQLAAELRASWSIDRKETALLAIPR